MNGAIDRRHMKKFTIQVFTTVRDDDGKRFRATTCYQGEGKDIKHFLQSLDLIDWSGCVDVKYGAFLPGWHSRIP